MKTKPISIASALTILLCLSSFFTGPIVDYIINPSTAMYILTAVAVFFLLVVASVLLLTLGVCAGVVE